MTTRRKKLHESAWTALTEALSCYHWYKPPFKNLILGRFGDAPELIGQLDFEEPKRAVVSKLVSLLRADEFKYQELVIDAILGLAEVDAEFRVLARETDDPDRLADAKGAHVLIQEAAEALSAHVRNRERIQSEQDRLAEVDRPPLNQLNHDLDQVMADYQASHFDNMLTRLPDVVSGAHRAAYCNRGRKGRQAKQALALSGQAAAMVLTKLGEHDLAWIASERGLTAAQDADDEAVFASLQRSMVHTLQSHGRTEASSKLAERTADNLRSGLSSSSDREVSVYGTLLLAASMASARAGDSPAVSEYLDEADHYAQQLGQNTNHLWTAFGPTNVAVHRVATSVAQDDIAGAEKHTQAVDPESLPPERRIRYLFDLAMIAVQRDRPDDAIGTMLEAEQLGPEQVHSHVMGQQIVAHLRSSKAGRQDPRLAQLDRRTRRTKAVAAEK